MKRSRPVYKFSGSSAAAIMFTAVSFLLIAHGVQAQSKESGGSDGYKERRMLADARESYHKGDFAGVFRKLRQLPVEKLPDSLTGAYQYMLGSAAFALDSLDVASASLNRAIKIGLSDEQLAYATLRLGHIGVRQQRLTEAAGWYLVAATATAPVPESQSVTALRGLLERSDVDVSHLLTPLPVPSDKFCALVSLLGSAGQRLARAPGFTAMAADCTTGKTATAGALTIALVLPFSGENASYARQIERGVQAAIQTAHVGMNVTVRRFDTRSRVVDAARLGREMRDTSADLVIGPLTSEESAAFAAAADNFHHPVVVPAASETGLTELHPQLYQLTPSLASEATLMARAAREFLGADTAVVLVPEIDDYIRMGDYFAREFVARHGTILFQRTYDPRQKDFGNLLSDLKVAVGRTADSSKMMLTPAGDTLKPEHQPAGVDCLYVPCSAAQARALLPQLAFYSIQGSILGSTAWNDRQLFGDPLPIAAQTFFPAPLIAKGCNQREQLRTALLAASPVGTSDRKGVADQPERLEALGYDAVQFALRLSSGSVSPSDGSRDCGSNGMIAFSSDRINQSLQLCQWLHGSATAVDGKF